MLVTSKEILITAKKKKYAVPAPNFIDLDSARTYVSVAEKYKQPIFLAFAQAHQAFISLEEAALIGKFLAEKVQVPIVLHLDHGTDETYLKKAIDLGFTSVMIDASMASFEENVRRTQSVVKYAHERGVVVEAEIGHVGSGENYENHDHSDSIYTEVKDAIAFVEYTGVDSLAVSIGTAHGHYKGKPILSFERLHEISQAIETPLVLHGGSGSGDANLHRCATEGISKINIFTDFLVGAMNEIHSSQPEDYLALKQGANHGMAAVLEHYLKIFSNNEFQ